jgi:hypothetical protein
VSEPDRCDEMSVEVKSDGSAMSVLLPLYLNADIHREGGHVSFSGLGQSNLLPSL